jgi:hypothetical protein
VKSYQNHMSGNATYQELTLKTQLNRKAVILRNLKC